MVYKWGYGRSTSTRLAVDDTDTPSPIPPDDNNDDDDDDDDDNETNIVPPPIKRAVATAASHLRWLLDSHSYLGRFESTSLVREIVSSDW